MDIKFLSFLNSQIITDDYNEKFINYILKLISDYCIADEIILVDLTLKREKDCYSYYQKQYAIKNEDYVVGAVDEQGRPTNGATTGCHLHFGIRIDEEYVDPFDYY